MTPIRSTTARLLLATLSTASTQEVHHPDFAALSERWERARYGLDVAGLALAIVEREQVLHLETRGVRDVESGAPVTPETMFYIASATKPFVAFALAQLAEEGALELDGPVKEHLPRLRLADTSMEASLTTRDLLAHRPGINSFPIVWLDAYTGEISEDRYYHFLSEVRPTGQVTYTNVHFTLAGRVLEAVSGQPWRERLARALFQPAGMTRTTGYADAMYADADVAIPTTWLGGRLVPAAIRKHDSTMHAAGGLGTTIEDLARWIALHLESGMLDGVELLSPEGVAELLTLQSESPDRDRGLEGFGLGWRLGERHGERLAQHGGGYVGSAARVSFLPELGVGVAVLANTDGNGQFLCDLVTHDAFDHLLARERPDPLPRALERWQRRRASGAEPAPAPRNAASALEGSEPPAWVGEYANPHWGTLRIVLERERLVGNLGHVRFELVVGDGGELRAFAADLIDAAIEPSVEGGRPVALTVDLDGYAIRFAR